MTENLDDYGTEVDYDESRWIRIPIGGDVDVETWAARTAAAWGKDLGRTSDGNWVEVLRLMLLRSAEQQYSIEPDALFMHVLAPPGEAPSPALAGYNAVPAEQPASEFARALTDAARSDAIEPPSCDLVTLATGTQAWTVTTHERDERSEILTELRVIWPLHDLVTGLLTTSGYDIGRILIMRDDLIALAGRFRFTSRDGSGLA